MKEKRRYFLPLKFSLTRRTGNSLSVPWVLYFLHSFRASLLARSERRRCVCDSSWVITWKECLVYLFVALW